MEQLRTTIIVNNMKSIIRRQREKHERSLDKLVELTKGYSGADIAALANAAAMSAIKEYVALNRGEPAKQSKEFEYGAQSGKIPFAISLKNFETALKKIKRKASSEQ